MVSVSSQHISVSEQINEFSNTSLSIRSKTKKAGLLLMIALSLSSMFINSVLIQKIQHKPSSCEVWKQLSTGIYDVKQNSEIDMNCNVYLLERNISSCISPEQQTATILDVKETKFTLPKQALVSILKLLEPECE